MNRRPLGGRILVGHEAERSCVRLLEQIPGFVGAVAWNEDLDAAESINRNAMRHPQRFAADFRRNTVRFEKGSNLFLSELTLDGGHGDEVFHGALRSHFRVTGYVPRQVVERSCSTMVFRLSFVTS